MVGDKKNYLSYEHRERGVALLTTLIVAAATVAFIAGVYYMIRGGLRVSTTFKQYTSTQEAAFGGVEYGISVFRKVMESEGQVDDTWKTNMGLPDSVSSIYPCGSCSLSQIKTISSGESGGAQLDVNVTIQCLDRTPIPGYSDVLVFPPPPLRGGVKSFYVYYRIQSQAKTKDTRDTIISDMETVCRMAL